MFFFHLRGMELKYKILIVWILELFFNPLMSAGKKQKQNIKMKVTALHLRVLRKISTKNHPFIKMFLSQSILFSPQVVHCSGSVVSKEVALAVTETLI